MGQKANPISLRLGLSHVNNSSWYEKNKSHYRDNVVEDLKIQNYFKKPAQDYSVGKVRIERLKDSSIKVTIFSGKVGLVLGKKGETIADIEAALKKITNKKVSIEVKEVRRPSLDARIIADSVCRDIENRMSFKRAANSALKKVMTSGAFGVKISCAGRLNGAEIARTESFKDGSVPLHTLRADIDYAVSEAKTTYGIIGVKVWICIKR